MSRLSSMIATSVGLAALIAVGTPAAAVPTARPGTRSPPAAAQSTATSWNYIRSTCRVLPAGTVCLSLLGNGQPSTYHLNLTFAPKAGQWFKPLAKAEWLGHNHYEWQYAEMGPNGGEDHGQYFGTTYHPLCDTACAPVTSTHTFVYPTNDYAVYTILFETPQGRYDVNAGVTVPRSYQDRKSVV